MKYVLESPVKAIIGTERFRTAIQWRNGVLIADEPAKVGGKDLGPDPYTLLLASLAACTLATLRMYIDIKGLEIKDISVEVNMLHRIEHTGMVMHIDRKISMENMLDPEIRQRLIRIAEHCPVSKILKGMISINTDISGEGVELKTID